MIEALHSIGVHERNKKFWEELIAYFPFTVILVFVMTSIKKTLVYIHNEVKKTSQFWRLQCWELLRVVF
jgi:hypothetical protein